MKTIKITENYPCGNIQSIRHVIKETLDKETYINNDLITPGILHNKNGPAFIQYYENGNIKKEFYYINGKTHRNDGPAEIWYYNNNFNTIKKIEFHLNDGNLRGGNRPYEIIYYENGEVYYALYVNLEVQRNKLFEQGSYFNYLHKIRQD